MEQIKKNLPGPVFILIIASLQTLASLLPGIILMEDGVKITGGLSLFIIYLLFSDLTLVLLRSHGQSVPLPIYIVKIAFSIIFIWFISAQLSFQHGIILIAYEVFQFLNFSFIYNYNQRLSYPFMTAFFKGIVFNLIISLKSPYRLQVSLLKPYLFSFVLLLTVTFLRQAFDQTAERKHDQRPLVGASALALVVLLVWQLQHGQLVLGQLITMIVLTFISFAYFIWEENIRRADFGLNLGTVIVLFIYYFF